MATTPVFANLDMEYADDTVLLARTAEIATALLHPTEATARPYGLSLNREKTTRLAFNSDEKVTFGDGTEVPRRQKVTYLGAAVEQDGRNEPELRSRIAQAGRAMEALRPVWSTRALGPKLCVMVVNQCIMAKVEYGLHTMWLTRTQEQKLEAFQIKCLRKVLRIRTTYASKQMGEEPVTNQEVARRAAERPLSAKVQLKRLQLLGHVLRQDGRDPMRAAAFDRFGHPRELGGAGRVGGVRSEWTEETMKVAAAAMLGEAGRGKVSTVTSGRVAALAQNRDGWSRAIKAWYKKHDWSSFTLFHSRGGAQLHDEQGAG